MAKRTREDQVKIDGKYYYKNCRCGVEKNSLKSSYCANCQRKIANISKTRSGELREFLKKEITVEKQCSGGELRRNKRHLIEFVDRIESRGGYASMSEVFIELITLFNFFGRTQNIDSLSPDTQLQFMWGTIKTQYKRIYKL